MERADSAQQLPENLPEPIDDGASDHLQGTRIPSVPLVSTSGESVDLASLPGITVVYCYPLTGRPDRETPPGWDEIPGARGCTPQSCDFRDHHEELRALGARVFGLSAQSTAYQQEAAGRLHLPYGLLSDEGLVFARALGLPTFEAGGMVLLKRLTMIINDGRIEKVFYPVFPPDENAGEVIGWLRQDLARVSDG
jgi:peroxiredoxin